MQIRAREADLRVAVILMTASSFVVPLVGLVNAPLLARALSPEGRGEVAAAMAPAVLMLAVATLGLPESLTYHVARRPLISRPALAVACLVTVVLGVASVGLVWVTRDLLADGDVGLGDLMLLAAVITVPALLVNLLRGLASGHQLWSRVAAERLVVALWRVGWILGLFLTDHLSVLSAVLVTVAAPFAGVIVYLPLIWARFADADPSLGTDEIRADHRVVKPLLGFGVQVWFGAVAMMLIARTGDLFMVPLASARDLGLYTVAVTISDVPILVVFAIQSAIFGVNSKSRDPDQTTTTSRLTLLVATIGCSAMAVLLPFAIVPLFGVEFRDALVPSLLLLLRMVYGIPGFIAAGALAAWGRPGLRSIGLGLTFAVTVAGFFLLVPDHGLYGAVWAGFATATVMNVFMIVAARREMGVRGSDFWRIRVSDVARLRREVMSLLARLVPITGPGRR